MEAFGITTVGFLFYMKEIEMALTLPKVDETFEVALRIDSALDMTVEEYNEYLKTCDKSLLTTVEGETPTFIVMRKVLPHSLAQKVENAQLAFKDGELHPQKGFIIEHVRCCIVGINNPPGLPKDQCIEYKKAPDGGCSDELISQLQSADLINDLYTAHSNACRSGSNALTKKKLKPS